MAHARCGRAKGDDTRIYSAFRFKGGLDEFEKRLQGNNLKPLVSSHAENPLWTNYVNEMDAAPPWFERAKDPSEKSFNFVWVPTLKLGKEAFDWIALLEIRVDAYKEVDGMYQFLGVCLVSGYGVGSTSTGSAPKVEVSRDSFGVKTLLAEKLAETEENKKEARENK